MSKMNIAITQRTVQLNGFTYDCMSKEWHLFLHRHCIHAIPNWGKVDISGMDMLILSGGNNTDAREEQERECVSQAIKYEIPVLGVCHGAFMLNKYFDGTFCDIKDHQNTVHPIELEGKTYMTNSYHSIAIKSLGSSLTEIGHDTEGHCEAFKHDTFPIWGVVWHPERMESVLLPHAVGNIIP